MSTLTLILGLPLVAAVVLAFVPRDYRFVARLVALGATAISAVLAVVLPGPTSTTMVTLSIVFTLLGAIGFFVGSVLMLPEMVVEHEP